jgi:hypothetical protein
VVAAEEQFARHLGKPPAQRQRGKEHLVRPVEAQQPRRPAHQVGAGDAEHLEAPPRRQQHVGQARRRVGAVEPARRVVQLAAQGRRAVTLWRRFIRRNERVAVGVDRPRAGVAEDDRRVALQHGDALGEVSRCAAVIVRRPLEIPPAGQLEGQVKVGQGADVLFVADVADPRVGRREAPADRLGPVGRGVVTDDQFEVRERLPEQRFDRLGEIPRAVVNRQANAHARGRGQGGGGGGWRVRAWLLDGAPR